MGFDLIGVKPKTKNGEYFRNNAWWWAPLWTFIADTCNDILTEEDILGGRFNDGHYIPTDTAKRISLRLEHFIKQGDVKRYEKEREEYLTNLPDEQCDICDKEEVRYDNVAKKNGIYGSTCNRCNGTKKVRPWECSCPFSEENVKKFIEFCKNSGGFEIW